jgi:hypothetical protein
MLRFDVRQIEAINELTERDEALVIADVLREMHAEEVGELPQGELDALCIASYGDAREAGLASGDDILLYVTAEVVLRPDFPETLPDLFFLLSDPFIPYPERQSALAREAARRGQ